MVTSASGGVSDKQDLLQVLDYAVEFFNLWTTEGRLTPEQNQVLVAYYKENRGRVETGGPPTEEMNLHSAMSAGVVARSSGSAAMSIVRSVAHRCKRVRSTGCAISFSSATKSRSTKGLAVLTWRRRTI